MSNKRTTYRHRTATLALVLSYGVASMAACTKPRETTALGAAAGGVMGAGLGAIIGNQTGNAGSGLAIGALAGAATGSLIGNALQAQQETVRAHSEALERQERVVEAQRAEIAELRSLNADVIERKRLALQKRGPLPYGAQPTSSIGGTGRSAAVLPAPTQDPLARLNPRSYTGSAKPTPVLPARADGSADASSLKTESSLRPERVPLFDSPKRGTSAGRGPTLKSATSENVRSTPQDGTSESARKGALSRAERTSGVDPDGCPEAERELQAAKGESDDSEKLFHLRRALRLCPGDARMHYELGVVYGALGRDADARSEFREALASDPAYAPARAALKSGSKDSEAADSSETIKF